MGIKEIKIPYKPREEFKDVPGYEGLYQAGTLGTVKSFWGREKKDRKNGKILKGFVNSRGYREVILCKNGEKKHHKIARLIAKTFLEGEKEQVNHKNGIKTDDRLENLEWCTCSENHKHAWRTGLRNQDGEKNPNAKLNKFQVQRMRLMGEIGTESKEIAKFFNISPRYVKMILERKRWSHV